MSRVVMAKVLNFSFEVSEFELQTCNTRLIPVEKNMNPLITPAVG